MKYDDWLVWQEHEYHGWNDEDKQECQHCGEPCKGAYCSNDCFEADML